MIYNKISGLIEDIRKMDTECYIKHVRLDPQRIKYITVSTDSGLISNLKHYLKKAGFLDIMFGDPSPTPIIVPLESDNRTPNFIQKKAKKRPGWLKDDEGIFYIWTTNYDTHRCVIANAKTGKVFAQPVIHIVFKDRADGDLYIYPSPDDAARVFDKIDELKTTDKPIWISYGI